MTKPHTVRVVAIATYQPAWEDVGQRVPGVDEDVTTMAVAAGRTALESVGPDARPPGRVVVVTAQPDLVDGAPVAVLALGLGLAVDVPVELRVGGGPATLDAVTTSQPDTLVIGVTPSPPAGAGAALIGDVAGVGVRQDGRSRHSLPMRVRHVGEPDARVYDDTRLLRERGWRPTVDTLSAEDAIVVGVPPAAATKLGSQGPVVEQAGAAAPLFALAQLAADGQNGRVVAMDDAEGAAVAVTASSGVAVMRRHPAAIPAFSGPQAPTSDAHIPLSMPAYDRAFASKIGLTGARCDCGEISFPPRLVCLVCHRTGTTVPQPLPRTGVVYTTVAVHVPVPGLPGPYSLAIVSLDGTPTRVLAHVTDAPAGEVDIGARGRLVLRRVATRDGVPDYGYGFQADHAAVEHEA